MSQQIGDDAVIAELTAAAESLMRAVEAIKRGANSQAEQILKEAEERTAKVTRGLGGGSAAE